MIKLILAFLMMSVLGCSQSNFQQLIHDSKNYKIFIDSQDNRMYLSVVENIPRDSIFNIIVRRYTVLKITDIHDDIVEYQLNMGQYCMYNTRTGEGEICEYRDKLTCLKF